MVLPDLIQDLARHGITASEAQVRLGLIASAGTMAYALGKFVSGSLADLFGGRRNFLGGMAGSILFTVLFVTQRRDSRCLRWRGWATACFNRRDGWGW